ncbi:hypothetical protein B0T17DRAFT_105392 [Bombardia bombarda]|uniref:DUF7137 domain-containing protein n=1 Tax=Bombardia bombarda TaxID=252184 RepID=A0AA40CFW4_9PEZI|nr:hypothetical protein B0T17DRAFT_105392 [Bombardia bombarda]
MKATTSIGQLAVALLSLSPLAHATAWPKWLPELDALVVRQDDGSSTNSPTSSIRTLATYSSPATASASPTPTSGPSSSNSDSDSATTGHNLNTAHAPTSGTGTNTGTGGTRSTTSAPKQTQFNPQDPAGGIVMLTPSAAQGTQLYKIGDHVTWGWNYTNLQGTPTALDVLVSCSIAKQTWTLTQNMTFKTAGSFTWDTGAYQQTGVAKPLLTEEYNLIIYDADSSISAAPEPGYLQPFTGLKFGLYAPQSYTSIADGWQCATCSAAMGALERRGLGAAVAMSAVTIVSFTWFVVGWGAFV